MARIGPATLSERLHRIEGQVRGVDKLILAEQPVDQILTQIQAIIASLESTKLEVVKKQIKDSVMEQLEKAVDLLK